MSDDLKIVAPQHEQGYTLEGLAHHLGLGTISAQAAYDWFYKRETLLRLVLTELETHKSDAATTEAAIRERITALRAAAVDPPPQRVAGDFDPNCPHCHGSGECSNAQFQCHCRWAMPKPIYKNPNCDLDHSGLSCNSACGDY